MEYIFYVVGIFIGIIISKILDSRKETHGIIEIDHDTEQCKLHITSNDLKNRKTQKAIFIIDHDAVISREEHIL